MNFIINNENIFSNSSIHNITRSKHHFYRLNANLSYFQKSIFYGGIKIFKSIPSSVTILKNDKAKFKAALRKYLHMHSFYSVDEIFMCKDDLKYFHKMFVVFYTANLYNCVFMTCSTFYCLYDTFMDLWNVLCIYITIYICTIYIYVYMYVLVVLTILKSECAFYICMLHVHLLTGK